MHPLTFRFQLVLRFPFPIFSLALALELEGVSELTGTASNFDLVGTSPQLTQLGVRCTQTLFVFRLIARVNLDLEV